MHCLQLMYVCVYSQRSPAIVAILPSPKEEANWLFRRRGALSPKYVVYSARLGGGVTLVWKVRSNGSLTEMISNVIKSSNIQGTNYNLLYTTLFDNFENSQCRRINEVPRPVSLDM